MPIAAGRAEQAAGGDEARILLPGTVLLLHACSTLRDLVGGLRGSSAGR